jgi:hypothetical protein
MNGYAAMIWFTKKIIRRAIFSKNDDDWDLARNLLNPGGVPRTLWAPATTGPICTGDDGTEQRAVAHALRPIWTGDIGYAARRTASASRTYVHPTGEVLVHLHPERWTLRELLEIQDDNPYLFNCQRLNNPVPASADNFPCRVWSGTPSSETSTRTPEC